MFKLIADPQFTHKVDVHVPVDGGHEKQSFKATFRVLTTDRPDHDLSTAEGSTEFLREVLVSVADVASGDGELLPYSDGLRDQLLSFNYVRAALARTYFEAVNKAATGN